MNEDIEIFPTLQEIREAHTWKRDYERYLPLSRYIYRPIGFLVTWVAVRLGITTEMASYFSAVLGVAGLLLLICKNTSFMIGGIILLHLFNLFDCVDGSIARATKTENPYGRFLDSICGRIVDLPFWGVVGFMAFRNESLLIWTDPYGKGPSFWLAVGGLTCFLNAYLSFIEMIFNNTLREHWDRIRLKNNHNSKDTWASNNKIPAEDSDSRYRYVIRMVNNNLRARENHYLLLIVAYLAHSIDLLLSIFLIYYLCQIVILLILFSKRGKAIKRQYM